MPSTYTTRNRLEKQAPGENEDTWGERFNDNTTDMADAAMDGRASFALSGSKTLTTANGEVDEARMRVLDITGGTGGTVTIPNLEKWYLVRNGASGRVTFTTGSGTSVYVPPGFNMAVFCDGNNVVHRMPQTARPRFTSTDTTITPDDDGGEVRSTSAAQRDFTVAPESAGAWASDARVICFGASSGGIRILQGSGVTINWNGLTGTRTIAAGHRVYLDRNSSNDWLLSGSGIS